MQGSAVGRFIIMMVFAIRLFPAHAQDIFRTTMLPTGSRPMGIATATIDDIHRFAAIALPDSNTVEIWSMALEGLSGNWGATRIQTYAVSAPADVVSCGGFIITSSLG